MNHIAGHELIGKAAWDKLVAHAGGCEIGIPANLDSGNGRKFAALVGETAAEQLIGMYAGDRLYIASNWEYTLCTRYAEILAMHERGMTPAQIARAFEYRAKYSERNIRMVLEGRFDALRDSIGGQYGLPGI